MIQRFFRILPFLALTLWATAEEPPPLDITPKLEPLRAKYQLPACAAAVVESGRLTAAGATGLRRIDRSIHVTTGDIWSIGSCTKSMTATLAGMLVDAGKLRWDMPVPEALPGFGVDAAWRQVTIWDLVTHRSGIGKIWFPENAPAVGLLSPRERREAFVRSVLSRAPAESPGKSAYSNAGYAILGVIIEHLSGDSYEEMLRKHLFVPLALNSAGFGRPGLPGKLDEPVGHRRQGDRILPSDSGELPLSPVMAPAAAVHLSLLDFAKYAAWISTNTPRLLTPETFARLQTPPEGDKYAGGVWKTVMPGIGGEALCHTGTVGGFFAVLYTSRERSCVAVFNIEGAGWEWLGDEIVSAALTAAH